LILLFFKILFTINQFLLLHLMKSIIKTFYPSFWKKIDFKHQISGMSFCRNFRNCLCKFNYNFLADFNIHCILYKCLPLWLVITKYNNKNITRKIEHILLCRTCSFFNTFWSILEKQTLLCSSINIICNTQFAIHALGRFSYLDI